MKTGQGNEILEERGEEFNQFRTLVMLPPMTYHWLHFIQSIIKRDSPNALSALRIVACSRGYGFVRIIQLATSCGGYTRTPGTARSSRGIS
jgi:hypothetical protein